MKKTVKVVSVILVVFTVIFAFSSCSSSKDNKLIGNWKSPAAEIAYVFQDDGTYYYYVSTLKLTGEYKIKDHKITLNLDTTKEGKEYNYKIKKDVLYLYTDNQEMKDGIVLNKVEKLKMDSIDEIINDLQENKNKK